MSDVVVLRHKIHGLSVEDYAATLQSKHPEWDVTLAETRADENELLAEATVATGYNISREQVEIAESLELFMCTFAGTGHLPTETLEENGVTIASASGVHGPNVAEQVLGYLLSFVRRLDLAWEQKQRHEWNHFQAGELGGSTATVVGLGPIGQTIVDRLNAFDVHTIGVRYSPSKGGPADEIIGFDEAELDDAFSRTDYLVLACPLTDLTAGLVDEEALLSLPTEAIVVNVARGKVVNTDALVTALQSNMIFGAALDVTDPEPLPPESPLWRLQNCYITPHNAGHTPNYWERCAEILDDVMTDLL